jgi:hypothetical protein
LGREYVTGHTNAISSRAASVSSASSKCATGQCTGAPYSSLGICYNCHNLSNLLVPVCQTESLPLPLGAGGWSYPCGYQWNGTFVTGVSLFDKSHTTVFQTIGVGDQVFLNKSSHYWNSTVFMNASNVILDFYIAFVPGGEAQIRNHTKPIMMECMYQWCVKTFETSYSAGFLKETVLSAQLPQDRDLTTATEGLAYPADGPYVLMAAG